MAKNQPINVDVDDLRKVYLHTFDSFATDPSVIEEEVKGINAKYARLLLKVLTDANIVAMNDVNGEADVWQTYPETSDDMTREQAEERFEAWAEEADLHAITLKSEPRVKAPDTIKPCYCGCGEKVPGKSFYRPGHDARHAGVIGRLVASTGNKDHYNDLPSQKLTLKAQGIAERTLAKQDAKRKADHEKVEAKAQKAKDKANATPISEPESAPIEEGQVRVGKTLHNATRTSDGTVTYMVGDVVKTASKSAAKTFKPVA